MTGDTDNRSWEGLPKLLWLYTEEDADEVYDNMASDFLSDTWDFCVNGFQIDEITSTLPHNLQEGQYIVLQTYKALPKELLETPDNGGTNKTNTDTRKQDANM